MHEPTNVEELLKLYEEKGGELYGEHVTQLEHGLQLSLIHILLPLETNLCTPATLGKCVFDRSAHSAYYINNAYFST